MDSGNSGSIQSSSGGDEEFDSRGESNISSFLNPSNHFGSIPTTHTQFHTHQNPNFFDPQNSQNLEIFSQSNPNPQYNVDNNDLIWSRGLRSDPHQHMNYGNFGNLSTTISQSRTQPIASPQGLLFSSQSSTPFANPRVEPPSDQGSNQIKNSKKRARASRRAPTTVLTTDTTNFRQMVQEFTGIPAGPFSGSSPYSRRLDLFSAASAMRPGAHLADSLGPLFQLKPSSHKVNNNISSFSSSSSSPSLLNSTMMDSMIPTTTTTLGSSSTSHNLNNFQLPHNHLLNLQDHGTILNNKVQWGTSAYLSDFPSQETSSSAAAQVARNHSIRNNDGIQGNLVGFDANNIERSDQSQRVMSGYNLNHRIELAQEKGPAGNVDSSGGEGTVPSWICPSD